MIAGALTLTLAAACAVATPVSAADPPRPAEFGWRAPIELPAGASLIRVDPPAEALMRLQMADGSDLRVFNGAGQAVAQAWLPLAAPPDAAPRRTPDWPAYVLRPAVPGTPPTRGSVQVRLDEGAGGRTLWMTLPAPQPAAAAAAAAAASAALPAALFDTRSQKAPVRALIVQGQMPANVPVAVTVSTSPDLAQWTAVPVQGRLYRFEGPGAPSSDRLEFDPPLVLDRLYLRLDWRGHEGVSVRSVAGEVGGGPIAAPRPRAALPPPRVADGQSLEWETGFATPIAALRLGTTQANTLVPVSVLGRNEPGQPWRLLARTVVYRLGSPGAEAVNPPTPLPAIPVRWLRIEATHGLALPTSAVQAEVEFQPRPIAFLATGAPPFELAAGRADTVGAALPLTTLVPGNTVDPSALPKARLGNAITATSTGGVAGTVAAWLPRGVSVRTAALWSVLGLGVLVLGAVAWSVSRQLGRSAEDGEPKA